MSQSKKNQSSIKKLFGWSSTSQVASPNRENCNFDLNEDLDILRQDEECDEEFQGGEPSTQKKRKLKVRREFREQWKTKYKWLREAKHEGKTVMKCIYCETHKAIGPWGVGTGCSTLQHDSIVVHASSNIHKLSQAKWICGNERKAKPIPEHIACIDERNKDKIITTMKLVYWMVQEDLPLSKYESLCLFTMSLQTPNMPKIKDYTSYTNHMAAKEFIFAISDYLEELQISRMLDSPFFSLMLDESTDRSLEKHLVVYATFLDSKGFGPPISQFLKLINVCDGRGKTTYDAINDLIAARGLSKERLIGVSTDGASSMVGVENGFVTFMKKDVPNLVGVHCIAHREALATSDASKRIPELLFVEKLANKVYSWVQNSTKRNSELIALQELMQLETLNALQIHGVRWLSRGQVIERLVVLMPPILTLWKTEKKDLWYDKARIFSVQFCLHMLADVMSELNKLNKKFQEEYVDVTSLGAAIDVTINTLKRWFLRNDTFADGTCYLSKFLDAAKFGYLEICDKEGLVHRHELRFVAIPHTSIDYGDTQRQSWKPCIEGSVESCKQLAKDYVQALVDSLNGRFPDLSFFNSARLFSPCHYLQDVHDRERNSKRWLDKIFQHVQHTLCEKEEKKTTFDFEACLKELHPFVDTLRVNCEGSSIKDAWRIFCVTELHTDFPNMLKLWQAILTIPASTVACERGFSRQNIIKDVRRTKLSLDTLDALMRVSLTGLDSAMVEWDRVYEIWKAVKERRILNI